MISPKWKDTKIAGKLTKAGVATDHKYRDRNSLINFQQNIIDKYLSDYSEGGAKVLDVSTGAGVFVELMEDLGNKVKGTEKPGTPYQVFHKSQKTEVVYHDSTEVPFPFKKNEFDLVTCISSFNFYPEDQYEAIFKEFFRIAKKTVFLMLTRGEALDRNKDLFETPVDGWTLSMQGAYYRWDKD